MQFRIHTESKKVIQSIRDEHLAWVLTEPFFSYHHPKTQTKEQYVDLIQQTHGQWYVNINGYLEDSDIDALKVWLRELIAHKPLGFYFSDMAVWVLLNELEYTGERIYAPETILTNSSDITVYNQTVDRCVCAKELTLDEYVSISLATQGKVEVYACGYPLMSVSKRPLLQAYLDEINHPAKPLNEVDYAIKEQKRSDWMPILEEAKAFSVYSAELMFIQDELKDLNEAQVYAIHADGCFILDEDFIEMVQSLIHGRTLPEDIQQRYHLGKGYLYRKTNLTNKEAQ